ncbi:MAG: DUF5685 family protein [Syntrophaceticus sp.]|nr:DUF5685 family protein [Syntrophaceticus sp.]MDD3314006.1 DUF5685 family protein [Syntrophaceticus sp.]MDD4359315.1 DUF5685 family protein [Syntrophaceticus sp.]
MFGYVIANIEKLTDEEKQHYRAFYCGLCRSLKEQHGTLSRLTLNYDMTFLVLFLSALYKTDSKVETERCILHPFKPRQYIQNEITDYAADMNIVLAYYNCLDDWTDDRKRLSLMAAKLLEQEFKKVVLKYPNKCSAISDSLNELSSIEKAEELNPDLPANCFGQLMGEVFIWREDEYTEDLQAFGRTLGRFIYIMDACLDLKADIKHERYNPLVTLSSENFKPILNLLMADCTEKYKQLPIDQDQNLIDNILYSGIWTRHEAENKKKRRGNKQ